MSLHNYTRSIMLRNALGAGGGVGAGAGDGVRVLGR